MRPVSEKRLLELIRAYGSNPARWPEDEREAARARQQHASADFERTRADEARLDALLKSPAPEPASAELQARIARIPAANPRPGRRMLTSFWPFAPTWQAATGLSAAAILGLLTGIAIPLDSQVTIEAEDSQIAIVAAAGGIVEEDFQ